MDDDFFTAGVAQLVELRVEVPGVTGSIPVSSTKTKPTAREICEAWIKFKPAIPLAYIVASRRAARNSR